jgi:hypothetical protein
VLLATGCARRSANDITGQLAPFMRTRDQAVENVAAGKASLDPASLNQSNVCYGDLRTKAGQYSDFIVGAIQSAAFDESQNETDETGLEVSIASYNDCLLKLQKVSTAKSSESSLSLLTADWVPAFSQAIVTYWTRDGALVQSLSPDDKAHLIDQVKSMTAWPDFASIGAGTPATPR